MTTKKVMAVLVGLGISVVCSVAQGPAYKVTDLGAVGLQKLGLNNRGLVCGTADTRAFVWSNGVTIKLGTLGPPAYSSSTAAAINDSGQVVGGSYDVAAPNPQPRAVLFSAGEIIDLGTLPGAYQCRPVAINNAGQAVGDTITGQGGNPYYGTLWAGGEVTSLGLYAIANDINNHGTIVGMADPLRACVFNPGGDPQLLPNLPGSLYSEASAINDSGIIVGWCQPTNFLCTTHAVAWIGGTIHDLGVLETPADFSYSAAADVNSAGTIVGSSDTPSGRHAFIYDSEHGLRDLNALINPSTNWVLQSAEAINDSEQIVGNGLCGGNAHAFLLTPVPALSLVAAGTAVELAARKLAAGSSYTLQYSTDLTVWRDVCTFTAASTQTNCSNVPGSAGGTFYRLKY